MQLVYRLAFTICGLLAFAAAVTAATGCNQGNIALSATPTPTPSPGPIVASPTAVTLSVSQANLQQLVLTQSPGNPGAGIATPTPLWPPKTDTCTGVYTITNGPVVNTSLAYQFGNTVSQMVINNIQGIKVGTCAYGISDGDGNSLSVTVTVNP